MLSTLIGPETRARVLSAVERPLEVLGEAPARAFRANASLGERLGAVRGAIDFRNVIAHDYVTLSAAAWDIARNELPALAREAAAEPARLGAEHR